MPVPAARCGRTTTRSPPSAPRSTAPAGPSWGPPSAGSPPAAWFAWRPMPPITAWHWIPCPENVTWTCRIPRNAVPYSLVRLAPASAAGPAQGDRPGTPDDIAAAAGWARVTVTAYGRQENRHVAEVTCAWYGSWHTRTVRLILSRDERTASGYDLALITTDLAASPVALVARYAAPWGIEQAFADARNVLAPAKPAAASGAPSSAPSRSPARAHHDRHLVRTERPRPRPRPRPMSTTAASASPGTGPRPSRPSRTCSSSCAAR
jgi:hypothetical protein